VDKRLEEMYGAARESWARLKMKVNGGSRGA
jgi:hypothetical protein